MEAAESTQNNVTEWNRGIGRSSSTELEGAIPQLCSTMATVRVSLAFAPINRIEHDEKKLNVKQLYLDLSNVIYLAYEVEDKDIIKAYNTWVRTEVTDPYQSDAYAKEALRISNMLQHNLYMKGYKDTNRSESLPFPMECYLVD